MANDGDFKQCLIRLTSLRQDIKEFQDIWSRSNTMREQETRNCRSVDNASFNIAEKLLEKNCEEIATDTAVMNLHWELIKNMVLGFKVDPPEHCSPAMEAISEEMARFEKLRRELKGKPGIGPEHMIDPRQFK